MKTTMMAICTVLLISFTIARGDLLVHYKFDEGSGTNAVDSAGGDNPGTFSTAPNWSSWPENKAPISNNTAAVQLSDNSCILTTPDNDALDGLGEFSALLWVKNAPNGYGSAYPRWIIKQDSGNKDGFFVLWNYGQSRIEINIDGKTLNLSYAAVNLDGWHNWAFVYDGSYDDNNDLINLYIDGELVNSGVVYTWSSPNPNDEVLSLGNEPTGSRALANIMDDFRLYNEALTQEQIMNIAEIPIPVPEQGTIILIK